MAINGKIVEHWQHDDVVNELRTCGQDVSLSVRAFDGANRILSPSKQTIKLKYWKSSQCAYCGIVFVDGISCSFSERFEFVRILLKLARK